MGDSRRNFGILGLGILSLLILSSSLGIQESYASHVVPTFTTIGPNTGVSETEFSLGDPTGIFVECSIPNTVAGDARIRVFATSDPSLAGTLAEVNFAVTDTPSVVSTTFDITDTGVFGVDSYGMGCTWQDEDGSGPDSYHNYVTPAYFDIVSGGNLPPVAVDDNVGTDEDTSCNPCGNVMANNGNGPDTDPDGDSLTVSEVNGSSSNVGTQISTVGGALLTVLADGTASYDPAGAFESLAQGENDQDSFTYTISDGNGGTDSATVYIDIFG